MYSNCCVICLIELKCICVFLNLTKSKKTDLHVNNEIEREREKKNLLENTLFYDKNAKMAGKGLYDVIFRYCGHLN